MNPTFFRLRITYAKQGRGRFLSHLEVQRALTRLARRSGLPFAVSQGFTPHLRLATGPALGVGVAGQCEYCDLTLTRYVKHVDALTQLKAAAPPYLPVIDAGYVNDKAASLNAAITGQEICATMAVPAGSSITPARLEAGFAALRARDTLEVEHKKGKTKVFDSATHVPNDVTVTQEGDTLRMAFSLRISPEGSLRPDALLTALLRELQPDSPKDYLWEWELVRTGLFIEDKRGKRHRPL
jgi:radical SAM-linked protein